MAMKDRLKMAATRVASPTRNLEAKSKSTKLDEKRKCSNVAQQVKCEESIGTSEIMYTDIHARWIGPKGLKKQDLLPIQRYRALTDGNAGLYTYVMVLPRFNPLKYTGPKVVWFRDEYLKHGKLEHIRVPLGEFVTEISSSTVLKPINGQHAMEKVLVGPMKMTVPDFDTVRLSRDSHRILIGNYKHEYVYLLAATQNGRPTDPRILKQYS